MQLSQKFLFDRDFDMEKLRQQQAEDMAQQQIDAPPPAPMYDEDTLMAAREAAYQQGIAAGIQQAEQGQQRLIAELWDRMGQSLAGLVQHEEDRDRRVRGLALQTAMHVIKKFWPRLQTTQSGSGIEQFIAELLAQNSEESRLVLRVNDAQLDTIAAQLPRLKELQGFQGKVITLADDSVPVGDCKAEWADGGAEKLSRHMTHQLDQLMERMLSGLGVVSSAHSSHDADTDTDV